MMYSWRRMADKEGNVKNNSLKNEKIRVQLILTLTIPKIRVHIPYIIPGIIHVNKPCFFHKNIVGTYSTAMQTLHLRFIMHHIQIMLNFLMNRLLFLKIQRNGTFTNRIERC